MSGADSATAGQVRGELAVTVQVVARCTATLTGDAVAEHCSADTPMIAREERQGEPPALEIVPDSPGAAAAARIAPAAAAGAAYVTLIY